MTLHIHYVTDSLPLPQTDESRADLHYRALSVRALLLHSTEEGEAAYCAGIRPHKLPRMAAPELQRAYLLGYDRKRREIIGAKLALRRQSRDQHDREMWLSWADRWDRRG